MIPTKPANPGEWHPAYDGHMFVTRWLGYWAGRVRARSLERPVYRSATMPGVIQVAMPVAIKLDAHGHDFPLMLIRTLEIRTASGGAVYTDTPCVWKWVIGVDDLGRMVASDSWRVPLPHDETQGGH
jgi:hypothetical protein